MESSLLPPYITPYSYLTLITGFHLPHLYSSTCSDSTQYRYKYGTRTAGTNIASKYGILFLARNPWLHLDISHLLYHLGCKMHAWAEWHLDDKVLSWSAALYSCIFYLGKPSWWQLLDLFHWRWPKILHRKSHYLRHAPHCRCSLWVSCFLSTFNGLVLNDCLLWNLNTLSWLLINGFKFWI